MQLAGPTTDSKSSKTEEPDEEPVDSDEAKPTGSEHRSGPEINDDNEEERHGRTERRDDGGATNAEAQPQQKLLEVILAPSVPENLFDFRGFELERRNKQTAHQMNLDAAKAKVAHLSPFETGYEKTSCLEGLDEAIEFLVCAESRVAKTPGGLPRPVGTRKKHSFNAHAPQSKLKRIHTFMLSKPHRQYSNGNFRKAKARAEEAKAPQRHPSVLDALVPPAQRETVY